MFQVSRTERVIDEVGVWLSELPKEYEQIVSRVGAMNVKSFELLKANVDPKVFSNIAEETAQKFKAKLAALPVSKSVIAGQLQLEFCAGPLKGQRFQLDGRRTTFGTAKQTSSHLQLPDIGGVEPNHFEVFYCKITRRLLMHSTQQDPTSGGMYRTLRPNEHYEIMPDDAF